MISEDEPAIWCTDAKLKTKLGVVSVTLEQHTDGGPHGSHTTLDLEMALCHVVFAHSRVEALERTH